MLFYMKKFAVTTCKIFIELKRIRRRMKCKRDIRFLGFTNFLCFLNSLKKMENKNYFYKNVVQRKENKNELFNSKLTFQHFFLFKKIILLFNIIFLQT